MGTRATRCGIDFAISENRRDAGRDRRDRRADISAAYCRTAVRLGRLGSVQVVVVSPRPTSRKRYTRGLARLTLALVWTGRRLDRTTDGVNDRDVHAPGTG